MIVDPFQTTDWKSIGLNNLRKAGYLNYVHYEEKSEFILPSLVQKGTYIDLGFIDGWHTFDHTLIDFFYINRMLKPGGIVIIDDVQMAAINKVCRFIHTLPCYEFLGSVGQPQTVFRNTLESVKSVFGPIVKLTGRRFTQEFFSSSVLKNNRSLGLNSSMVAFKKIGEDTRPWNWHIEF